MKLTIEATGNGKAKFKSLLDKNFEVVDFSDGSGFKLIDLPDEKPEKK